MQNAHLQAAADLVAQEPDERAERRAALPFEPDELAELDALTRAHTAFDDLLAMLEALGGYRPTLWTKTELAANEVGVRCADCGSWYDQGRRHGTIWPPSCCGACGSPRIQIGPSSRTDAKTLELIRLADAYDKAQAHRGDARRAFRGW